MAENEENNEEERGPLANIFETIQRSFLGENQQEETGGEGEDDDARIVVYNGGQGGSENEEENEELDEELDEELLRIEEEELANFQGNLGQVFITDMLQCYPAEKKNSNKIILPDTIFKELVDKKVWDNHPAGKPIIFQLEVADPVTKDVIETTYAGVEEFTAPPGKVGLPHKTALSLTKERGVGWLKQNPMVFISYVSLPTHESSFMQIQPRGKGFHGENDEVVNLDIKSILEKTLRDHIVLTKGDWIPIYHEGKWYELVVTETRPEETLEVLNTDLEVDILPAEEVEQEQKEVEQAKEQLKTFMDARNNRAAEKKEKIAALMEPAKDDKSAVLIRVKLPNNKAKQRRFSTDTLFGVVMDWTEVEMYNTEFIPSELPPTKPEDYWFEAVERIPRKGNRRIGQEDAWKSLKQVMEEGQGVTRGMGLIIQVVKGGKDATPQGQVTDQGKQGEATNEQGEDGANEWHRAFENLQRRIESGVDEVQEQPAVTQEQIDALAERLEAYGIPAEAALDNALKYPQQLIHIEAMGYTERMGEAITLLDSNNGGINQTIEALLNMGIEEQMPHLTTNGEDNDDDDDEEEERELDYGSDDESDDDSDSES